MKDKVQFYKSCGVGFTVVLALLIGTLFIRNMNDFVDYNNPLAFVAPLIFIPLLVSVLHSKQPSCYERLYKKGKGCYSKSLCTGVVGGLLVLVTFISAIVLYYGW